MKYYFPNEKNIDYNKLQMSRIGLYSISKEYINDFLEQKIKHYIPNYKKLTICDGNGGIGGDTLLFTKLFKFVNVVELMKLHVDMIVNNCNVYKRRNFKAYHDSIIDYLNIPDNFTKNEVLYFDPPWGGLDYKSTQKIELYYGDLKFSDFINNILMKDKNKKIIMKLPYNYDMDKIKSKCNKHKIGNVLFVFIN
jgi:16S rRNA G966 N2-methylase RsmD